MKTQQFVISIVVAVGVACAAMTHADVTTLQPKTVANGGSGNYHDAFIGGDGSYTGSGNLYGYIGQVSTLPGFRYLVQFDDLSHWIGGPERVTNATLKLLYYVPSVSSDPPVAPNLEVFRVTNSWVNGATQGSRGGLLGSWHTPGGDFDPTPVASLSFPTAPANFTIQSWDVTGLVSNWVVGMQPHYGFLVKWDNETSLNRLWFFSGPNLGGFMVPTLTFSTIPEPSSMILVGLGVAVVAIERRLFRRGG